MPAISVTPRAPVPTAQYQWVDRVSGLRRVPVISRAGLPLFPGTIGDGFRRLQGSSQSAEVLTRRIWLLHRGRSHLDIWKNAVVAVREARHKVVLPQSYCFSWSSQISLSMNGGKSPTTQQGPSLQSRPVSASISMGSPALTIMTSRPPILLGCGPAGASNRSRPPMGSRRIARMSSLRSTLRSPAPIFGPATQAYCRHGV